jgi:hypothetical protein
MQDLDIENALYKKQTVIVTADGSVYSNVLRSAKYRRKIIMSWPVAYELNRYSVYVYFDGDDPAGNGSLVFNGFCPYVLDIKDVGMNIQGNIGIKAIDSGVVVDLIVTDIWINQPVHLDTIPVVKEKYK